MAVTFRENMPPIEEYWELFETTGWNERYRATLDELTEAIANSWYLVAAYDRGRLVGFGRVVADGVLHAMIYDLIVNPIYQRQGIGTQILTRLVQACLAADIRDIQLFSAKGREAFYQKRGFVRRPADAPGMEFRHQEE